MTGAGQSRYLTFAVAGTPLAVPLDAAQEIVRVPQLVPVPLAPPGMAGLARRHGRALPVLDVRRVLGQTEADRAAAGVRLVVVSHGDQGIGLVVDAVTGVHALDGGRVDRAALAAEETAGIDGAYLAGALRGSDGALVALLLDTRTLIDRQFVDLPRSAGAGAAGARPGQDGAPLAAAAESQARTVLVSFAVAGQEFALPVGQVSRIVPLAGTVARMPNARPHLLGVVAEAGGLLPLVGLRALFGLDGAVPGQGPEAGPAAGGGGARVVIVEPRRGERVGLVVDAVCEILRPEEGAIGAIPAILAREAEFADLDGILRLDQGRRLVSILSAERMLAHTADLAAALGTGAGAGTGEGTGGMAHGAGGRTPAGAAPGGETGGETGAVEPHVVVRIGAGEYGLPVAAVREALRRPDALAPLPKAPDFVSGLANLRGTALPVLDPARILKLRDGGGDGQRPRILVVGLHVTQVGLAVDAVLGVVGIPVAAIEPAPAVSVAQRHLIRRVAHLDGGERMILLLEVDALLDIDQLSSAVETL